jgi:TrmH family RNA methyltransferase
VLKTIVVVVEPEYQINLGHIARTAKNFWVSELRLVNPKCKYNGKRALQYSKHARDLIEKAKLYSSMESATKNTLCIGTTGIWHKSNASFYNVYGMEEFTNSFSKQLRTARSLAVVLGREGTGLSREELKLCDATISIEANPKYPILNISHALSIVLYEISKIRMQDKAAEIDRSLATSREIDAAVEIFRKLVGTKSHIRDKDAVVAGFRHMLERSVPTRKELKALSVGLAERGAAPNSGKSANKNRSRINDKKNNKRNRK